jgi:hypothetical protein
VNLSSVRSLSLITLLLTMTATAGIARQNDRVNKNPGGPVQQDEGRAAIKTADGMLFVWNRPDIHFTVAIKGADVKPMGDPDHVFFNVDGKVLQIQIVQISEFAPDAKTKKLDDQSILAAHRDWESKYVEGLLNSQLVLQSSSTKVNGSDALAWQYDVPAAIRADTRKQLYLTLVSGDYVLLINSVATDTVSDEVARKFLLDTAATLKTSPTTIDVKKVAESIKAGGKP